MEKDDRRPALHDLAGDHVFGTVDIDEQPHVTDIYEHRISSVGTGTRLPS